MPGMEKEQEIFLQMVLQKGGFKTDPDGNFLFDVEASNENLDLEGQRVLQRALLESKDYFLTNGVISKDHLHTKNEDGRFVFDEEYVIGEPVAVYTDGKSTRVKGKLYRDNAHAKKFIDLLQSGSSRVKASVAGILPKIVKNVKDKTEKVVSVLWNDLALTIAPVNHTVQPAAGIMAKSLTSYDFVKALAAGYGTDSSQFTGGRALRKEDVEWSVISGTEHDEEAIMRLVEAMSGGQVRDAEEAKAFLAAYGFNSVTALDVIRELIKRRDEFREVLPMAKKGGLFEDLIDNIRKSMGGKPEKDEDPEKDKFKGVDDEGEDDTDGKDEEEDEVLVDAEEVIKALTGKVEELEKGQVRLMKSIEELVEQGNKDAEFKKSLGEGMIALMENTAEIAKSPLPRKGASSLDEAGIQKGGFDGGGARKHRQLTVQDKDELTGIITKAVSNNELTIWESAMMETQINKSIRDPNFQLNGKFLSFLEKKLAGSAA